MTKILNKVIHTGKSHSLQNFTDLSNKMMIDTESWEKESGLLHIKHFELLDKVVSTGNEVMSIQYDDEIDADVIHTYALEDIKLGNNLVAYEEYGYEVIN
jgi:hypothetical protein